MWWTVLLFGIAVNFEPTRIGLVALMLTKQRPVPQLMTFFGTAFAVSSTVGLIVLFVFHRGLFTSVPNVGPKIQLGIGLAVLLLAGLVATNPGWFRRLRQGPAPAPTYDGDDAQLPMDLQAKRIEQLATRVRGVVAGESRWFTGAIGAATALPTAEYMALLALIIVSAPSAVTRVAALFTFLCLGSMVGVIAMISYLISPVGTRARVQRFNAWVRSRRRGEVVAALAVIGAVLLIAGYGQL